MTELNLQGATHRIEGNKLILEIDLTQDFGPSSTGRSHVVASSGGFKKLPIEGLSISLGVYRSKKAVK